MMSPSGRLQATETRQESSKAMEVNSHQGNYLDQITESLISGRLFWAEKKGLGCSHTKQIP